MASASALVKLGDRYAALGLEPAARAVYLRAEAMDPLAAAASTRLAEIALARGEGALARKHAAEAARRAPSPAARLLLARAQVAAGELAAARFTYAGVLEAGGTPARLRAQAYLGRATVAAREGDAAGAIAHLLAALEETCAAPAAAGAGEAASDAGLLDEIGARAVALGRGADLAARIDEVAAARPGAGFTLALARAALLAAGQAHDSPGIADGDIESELERALAAAPSSRPVRLRLAARLSRRRYRDPAARARAVILMAGLARELDEEAAAAAARGEIAGNEAERARVYFLIGGLDEDDAQTRASAEDAYRKGLRLRPRHAAAANNLALLALDAGDASRARSELERALWLDPGEDVAWRNVARLLDATRPSGPPEDDVRAWLDAASPGAGTAAGPAARLVRAAAEGAAQAALEAVHHKGHRLKNLLGIAGARVRSARKLAAAPGNDDALAGRLDELERELGALYDEWAAHLRTLHTEGPRLEIVPVNALVGDVVAQAGQEGRPPVRFAPGASLPDLRGDRALLCEALLNVVVNAIEAQEAAGERERAVEVYARAVVSAGDAPAVEIEVRDAGPGIAAKDLARLFSPGFTTKAHGSGLGLAVTGRVVAAHHGRIHVDSEAGRGTTVTVVLPSDLGGFASFAPGQGTRAEP